MRIAILAPMTSSKLSDCNCGTLGMVTGLADGLAGKGIDTTTFTSPNQEEKSSMGSRVQECLQISELFDHADEFDLIHNHAGCLPLSYSGLVETPVVTTLYGSPLRESLSVYRKYNGRVFYISTNTSDQAPELTYLKNIDPESKTLVEDYVQVYEEIIQKTAREDHRPWGFYEVFSDREDHKVKRITVYPGKRLSYQRHQRRSEHWFVVDGEAVVTLDGREIPLSAGEFVDIPQGAAHRVSNPETGNMIFIEVQRGDYFGEDDIERLEDDFGRL